MKLERRAIKLLIWLTGNDEQAMQREQERYDRKRGALVAKWKQRGGANVKHKPGWDNGYVGMKQSWIGLGDWLALAGLAGLVLGAGLAWWRLA